MKKINVVSLFDGMRCGMVALERAGIPVGKYYASEIDKYAIQVANKNYPNCVNLGDVNNWRSWGIDWASIDLILAGFPCQAWSVAGKQQGLDDPRGQLALVLFEIFRYVRLMNPNVKFLFENVKMKKENIDFLNRLFGCEAVEINSALVSAQNWRRMYWTNIPNVTQPEDKGILLKDIVHEFTECVECKKSLSDGEIGYMLRGNEKWQQAGNCRFDRYLQYPEDKSFTLTANICKGVPYNCLFERLNEYIVPFDKTLQILDKEVERGKVGYFRKDSQANRVYYIHDKAVTLCGDAGGGAAKMGAYFFGHIQHARGKNEGGLSAKDKSPTMTSNMWEHNNHLLFGCITPDRVEKRQNGQRFNDGNKFYTLTAQDKHGVLVEGYIRKLTPIECERLQTVPDNYTAGVSNSQRYKMLGNGWTVDIIAHIFKGLLND